MKQGSKYYLLFRALQMSGKEEVNLTFRDIETIIEDRLPPSARNQSAWWSNRSRGASQANAWMDAGYMVVKIDFEGGLVKFRKPIFHYEVRREGEITLWSGEMIKALRYHMGVTQGELAGELGVRQQTVSEWETGAYAPKKAMSKLLGFVAERAGFKYEQKY